MATYYVDGANGNDGDDGTDPIPQGGGVGPKATLNGAEDIPVAAADLVQVRPIVPYREMLTVDVSGAPGNPITYEADVTGRIWGVGGVCRITGSDDDQAAARPSCINTADTQRNYRTFRGFWMDTTNADYVIDNSINAGTNWIIEDCAIQGGGSDAIILGGANQADWIIRRSVFICPQTDCIEFGHVAVVDGAGHLVENCLLIPGGTQSGINFNRVGGNTIRNCVFLMGRYHIRIVNALTVGQTIAVNNNIFTGARTTCLEAKAVGEIVENFNDFFRNAADRLNTDIGGNSLTYPPLFSLPLLHAGVSQISGFKFPWWFGELSEWSQIAAITGSNEPTEDLRGIARPVTASKNSWGPCQFMDMERETGTVHAGTASMALHDAGRHQIWVPVANESTTISVYVYREANYAGNLPQMIIKQPGQADDVTTDVAAASQWNLLTTTLTPAAGPPYVVVELVSRNTNGAADEAFFGTLSVS